MSFLHSDLNKISQITDNIFLSGIYPLRQSPDIINKLNIKYILSCVDSQYIHSTHEQILNNNQNVTILYIPYSDITKQNLWEINKGNVNIIKLSDYENIRQLLNLYYNKSMIEIAYHFINNAINNNENILIHCMAGISRSVSMLVYYLMKKCNLIFEDAMLLVKQSRSVSNPNRSFKKQLKGYQFKRHNYTSDDAEKVTKDYI